MSLAVKIYDTDSAEEIAKKIFYEFDVMSSCSIYGFETDVNNQKLIPKGELVLKHLEFLDMEENCRYVGDKKVRNYKYRKNSIGGTIAQKIFTWEKRVVDNEPRFTIWRFQ